MEVIKLTLGGVNRGAIARIARVLAAGGVVVYPSDTVYGLGAIISSQKAADKIRYLKGGEYQKPLPILVRDLAMASRYGHITPEAKRYLPGVSTLLVNKKPAVKEWVSRSDLVSIRWPNYWFTNELMHNMVEPVIAVSAGLSGYPPVYSINELLRQLGERAKLIDLIIDAGVLLRRPLSPIVDLANNKIISQ